MHALQPLSLQVPRGQTLAIVGPSGSGKTTLLGLMAGLDRPTTGQVWLAGQRLDALSEDGRARIRARHVGFVFQNFQLMPTLTAWENVRVPLELSGSPHAADKARHWLEQVGLGHRLKNYPVQLSGGEQQRVALARAFVTEPEILFADEPTGNLDGDNALRVRELLFNLNAQAGTTLVLSTHAHDLAACCQRQLTFRLGALAEDRMHVPVVAE